MLELRSAFVLHNLRSPVRGVVKTQNADLSKTRLFVGTNSQLQRPLYCTKQGDRHDVPFCCRKGVRVVCVPVGISSEGFAVSSRIPLQLRAVDILTGRELGVFDLAPGKRTPISLKSAAFILMN